MSTEKSDIFLIPERRSFRAERNVEPVAADAKDAHQPTGGPSFLRLLKDSTKARVALMEGERELTTGLLSRDASFRLVVTGPVGVKEIDRLIRKLQFDKEILSEVETGENDPRSFDNDPGDADP